MKTHLLSCVCLTLAGALPSPVRAQEPRTVQELIKVVEDPDKTSATKLQALTNMQKLGEQAAPAIPLLTKLVSDTKAQEKPELTSLALGALGCLKATGKPGIPGLRAGLKSKKLQIYAAIFLGEFGADAKAAVPDMLACIAADPVVCCGMFADLDKIGPEPKALVPVAIKVINLYTDGGGKAAKYASPARLASQSLAKVGPAAKEAIPVLIGVLKLFEGKFYDGNTLKQAIETLGAIGPEAVEALPLLRTFLDKNIQGLSMAAEKSIEKIKAKK